MNYIKTLVMASVVPLIFWFLLSSSVGWVYAIGLYGIYTIIGLILLLMVVSTVLLLVYRKLLEDSDTKSINPKSLKGRTPYEFTVGWIASLIMIYLVNFYIDQTTAIVYGGVIVLGQIWAWIVKVKVTKS